MGVKEKFLKHAQKYYSIGVWNKISEIKGDQQEFIEAVKHRIDVHNDFEFNQDYTMFKRVISYHQFMRGETDPDGEIPRMVSAYHDFCMAKLKADPEISRKLEESAAERKQQYSNKY